MPKAAPTAILAATVMNIDLALLARYCFNLSGKYAVVQCMGTNFMPSCYGSKQIVPACRDYDLK